MMIIVLALLHCTIKNEQFFPHFSFCTYLWHMHILMYSMSTGLLVIILFLIDSCHLWNNCSMYEFLYKWGGKQLIDYLEIRELSETGYTYTFVWFRFTPCMLTERHSIFAGRPMSLAAGVRAMHTHGKAFNICHNTDESGLMSQSNACPDTWRADGVAFECSLQTSPLCSLNLRGCHGDFDQKKIRHLPKILRYATTNLRCTGTGPLRTMLFIDFSYGSEWYFLIFMHLHINITVFRYN